MKKLNEFILTVLLMSIFIVGGCSLIETLTDLEVERGYYMVVTIMLVSTFIYTRKV